MDENKKKALAAALGQIERQFGKGSVMLMGDKSSRPDVGTISTGSLGIDIALGIGCLLYTSPSPRDRQKTRMPSSA